MAEPLPVYPLTVDDYHAMAEAGILSEDARVELIDGQLVAKMPIGPDHVRVVNALNELVVTRASDVAEVSVQNPVRLNLHNEPEPDVVLLKKDRDRSRLPHATDVLLLVEVADSSLRFDREVKVPRYASAGVREVWIVDVEKRCVECYRDLRPSGYATVFEAGEGERIDAQRVPELGLLAVSAILGD